MILAWFWPIMIISEHPRLDFQISDFCQNLCHPSLENIDFQKAIDIIILNRKTSKIENVVVDISKSPDWIFFLLQEMKVYIYMNKIRQ